jgi:hypothetical protein
MWKFEDFISVKSFACDAVRDQLAMGYNSGASPRKQNPRQFVKLVII